MANYTLTVDRNNVIEGESVTLRLNTTTAVPAGTVVNLNVSGSISPADMVGNSIPTFFTLDASGATNIPLGFINDSITEGMENLTLSLRDDPTQTVTINVNDSAATTTTGGTTTATNRAPTIPTTPINLPNGTANTPYQISKTQLLTGFNDADGDVLTVMNLFATNGTITPNGDGWTFTPNSNYSGVVNLNYSVTDNKPNGMVAAQPVNFNLNPATVATNNPPTGLPTIEGVAKAGAVLSVNTMPIFDVDGINASTFNFQWFVDNSPMATGLTYTVAPADTGKNITVKANYTDNLGHNETVTSNNVIVQAAMNNPPTGNITIEGVAKTGAMLTVKNTVSDIDGINGGLNGFSYQWFVDGTQVSSQNNYTVAAADTGRTITVKGSYTDMLGKLETVNSGDVMVQAAPTYSLFVDKPNVTEGDTVNLTVQSSANFASPNEVVNLRFSGSASNMDVNGGFIPTSVNLGADGKGQVSLSFLKDNVTEGMENLTFALTNDSTKFVTININDAVNPPTYNFWVDKPNANEGDTANLTLQTTNVPAGTVVNVMFTGSVTPADLNGNFIPASFNIGADGKATIPLNFLNDKQKEGAENLTFTLATDPTKSVTINVNDPMNNAPTGNVMITGEPKVGQTLFANTANVQDMDGLGAMNYQWLSDGAIINGKTGQNYTLMQEDANKNISVQVSYTDGLGNFEKMPPSQPLFVQQLKPTYFLNVDKFNVNEGETANLTLQTTNVPAGTAVNFNASGNVTPMDMASGSIPNTFFVDASGTTKLPLTFAKDTLKEGTENLILTLSNDPTKSVTINVNDLISSNNPPTGNVMITGDAKVGKTLFADASSVQDVDGLGAMSYQWISNGAIINGKTGQNYTLAQEDANKNISVQISYTDGLGNFEKMPPSPALFVQPSVIQPIKPTYSLSVDRVDVNEGESVYFKIATTNVPPESNINFPVTFSGSITNADVDKDMLLPKSVWIDKEGIGTIAVSFLNDNKTEGQENLTATLINGSIQSVTVNVNDTSNANGTSPKINHPPVGDLVIKGDVKVGQTLTVQNNITDADGISGKFDYQWKANNISFASGERVTLTQSEIGKTIHVIASYTDNGGTLEKVKSLDTPKVIGGMTENNLPTGEIVIEGVAKVGEILTVQNTLDDADGLGEMSYQWLKNGKPMSGATQENYTLTKSDLGKAISVTVSYIDGLKHAESMTSDSTELVETANPTYALSIDKTTVDEGDVIDFTLETTDVKKGTIVSFTFDGDISDDDAVGGLPEPQFVIGADGKANLSIAFAEDKTTEGEEDLTVTLIDDSEQSVSVLVNDTSFKDVANHKPTGSVRIAGTAKVGTTLTITNTLKDADGLGDFSYQWFANGSEIKNAVKSTYSLTDKDVNKKMSVSVSYVDGLEFEESKISAETATVKASIIASIKKTGDSSNNKLVGAEKNDVLSGLAGNDTLIGNAGNDVLDGGAGHDSLDGGNGNDELAGGDGKDSLIAGSGNDLLEGDKDDDKLQGDAGKDTLNGGAGIDDMAGGAGDDYYFVDHAKDVVTEAKSAGTDTVESTLSYTLSINIENLLLVGILDSKGTGNALNNTITGNVGDNVLNGAAGNDKLVAGAGADTLDGGLGMDTLTGGDDDDIYFMNNDNDKIIETETGGEEDEIIASVNFDLNTSPNVEMLTLSGAKAITGTGDEFNNLLQEIDGGKIANVFNGGAGDDTINAEGGNDTLEGGAGDDEIDGGVGKDTVIFTGAETDYQITRNPDADEVDQIIVEYVGTDPEIQDGKDILTNVETLQFADGETLNVRDVTDSSEMVILTGQL